MTIANNANKITYQGNGSVTNWSIPFPYPNDAAIQVSVTDPDGNVSLLSTGYLVDTPNAQVIYPYNAPTIPVLPVGWKITIYRSVPLTQKVSLPNQGPFLAKVHESVFDKLTMIAQQLQEQMGRALQHAISADADVSTELPAPVPLQSFRWDATGKKLETTLDPATVLPDALAAKDAAETAQSAAETAKQKAETAADNATNSAAKVGGFLDGSTAANVADLITKGPWVDVRAFGAKGDGITDDISSIQAAIDFVASNGGGIVELPAGILAVSSTIVMKDNVYLRGKGVDVTVIKPLADSFQVIQSQYLVDGGMRGKNYRFSDFTIQGRGIINPTTGTDSDRAMVIEYADNVECRNVKIQDSRFFSLTFYNCNNLLVSHCWVLRSARDGINATASQHVKIIDNTIQYCDDDAIALHYGSAGSSIALNGPIGVIANNTIEYSQGIKALSANGIIITNNVLRKIRNMGISVVWSQSEGNLDSNHYIIADNIIEDLFNFQNGTLGRGIEIITSSTNDVGIYKNSNWVLPENNIGWQDSPRGGGWRFTVQGNIICQKSPSASYNVGWRGNTALTLPTYLGQCVFVQGNTHNVRVQNNTFYRFTQAVYLYNTAFIDSWCITGNYFIRGNYGVSLGTSSVCNIKTVIVDNFFDLDPYQESSLRNDDGSWNDGTDRSCAWLTSCQGVFFANNTIRNCLKPYHYDSQTQVTTSNNFFYKGTVRTVIPTENYVLEDGNKHSSTFGQILFTPWKYSNSAPTTGTWTASDIIYNTNPTAGSYVGWVCVTSGAPGAWKGFGLIQS